MVAKIVEDEKNFLAASANSSSLQLSFQALNSHQNQMQNNGQYFQYGPQAVNNVYYRRPQDSTPKYLDRFFFQILGLEI
jgi:hypothetical protein